MKINRKKNIFSTLILIIFLVIGFFLLNFSFSASLNKNLAPEKIKFVEIAGKKLKVDLALTPETQERGLSGRISLKDDEGMLFVFKNSGIYYFWMKEMNFPIDMIWIDENFNVIYIKKNATPESYPDSFGPNKNAKYVLEVVSNFSENNNLKEGEKVKFLP